MTKTFLAWAVKCRDTDIDETKRIYFTGRYTWLDGKPAKLAPQTEGCVTALFATRDIARRCARQNRAGGHITASPVRVLVQITEVPA